MPVIKPDNFLLSLITISYIDKNLHNVVLNFYNNIIGSYPQTLIFFSFLFFFGVVLGGGLISLFVNHMKVGFCVFTMLNHKSLHYVVSIIIIYDVHHQSLLVKKKRKKIHAMFS